MSFRRSVNWRDFPKGKGPNGLPTCRWCRREILEPRRRTVCGNVCQHEINMRTNPGYARSKVEERDGGVCAICGLDTSRIQALLEHLRRRLYDWQWERPGGEPCGVKPGPVLEARVRRIAAALRSRGFNVSRTLTGFGWRALWEMDHVLPVVEGGGECGLEGLRTACIPCHKQVTRELAARRAALGRPLQRSLLDVIRSQL